MGFSLNLSMIFPCDIICWDLLNLREFRSTMKNLNRIFLTEVLHIKDGNKHPFLLKNLLHNSKGQASTSWQHSQIKNTSYFTELITEDNMQSLALQVFHYTHGVSCIQYLHAEFTIFGHESRHGILYSSAEVWEQWRSFFLCPSY